MPAATTSDYLYTKQLDYLLSNTSWTAPATIYVALFTTSPDLDGTGGTEVSNVGTGYSRVPVNAGGWTGAIGVNLEYNNTNDIQFGTPSASWGTIVSLGLYDTDIGGANNLLFVSPLTTPKSVLNGDGAPKVLAGEARISRATG